MEDETKKDLILRDLYYSPKTGFRSAQHLWELALKEDSNITLKDVREWLLHQQSFTKYKTFNNPSIFRHTFVRYLGEQVQMDLIDLPKLYKNGNLNFVLVIVEILSRTLFAYPLKNKTGKGVCEALESKFFPDFEKRFGKEKLKLVQFDEGSEFLNKDVKSLLDSEEIIYFSTGTKRKATIVERTNRTFKSKIDKYIDTFGNQDWDKKIPEFVQNYNSQHHTSIGMAPDQVNTHNQYTVWGRLFGHIMNHVKNPKFKVGDKVRVLHFIPRGKKLLQYFSPPEKRGRQPGGKLRKPKDFWLTRKAPFSEEIFRIDKVLLGDPVVYKLFSDEADLEILGIFYEQELSLVK